MTDEPKAGKREAPMSAPACHWWNRWLHRRQREADVLFLLPAFALKAEMDGGDDVEARIDAAFALHASLPGQEHWRCECAQGHPVTRKLSR